MHICTQPLLVTMHVSSSKKKILPPSFFFFISFHFLSCAHVYEYPRGSCVCISSPSTRIFFLSPLNTLYTKKREPMKRVIPHHQCQLKTLALSEQCGFQFENFHSRVVTFQQYIIQSAKVPFLFIHLFIYLFIYLFIHFDAPFEH